MMVSTETKPDTYRTIDVNYTKDYTTSVTVGDRIPDDIAQKLAKEILRISYDFASSNIEILAHYHIKDCKLEYNGSIAINIWLECVSIKELKSLERRIKKYGKITHLYVDSSDDLTVVVGVKFIPNTNI